MIHRISLASMRPGARPVTSLVAILALVAVLATPALARDVRRGAVVDRVADRTAPVAGPVEVAAPVEAAMLVRCRPDGPAEEIDIDRWTEALDEARGLIAETV